MEASQLSSPYRLDTVRGSHLVIQQECLQGYLLEVPNERRIFFVLPWQGQTLVGTTEVRQAPDEAINCSRTEQDYLLAAYNHYHTTKLDETAISSRFAGVRPLLYSANDPGRATREYAIERNGKLINVFGGKVDNHTGVGSASHATNTLTNTPIPNPSQPLERGASPPAKGWKGARV